jgi:hypothetical protein
MNTRNSMAANATLHCLTGCAIGEILGLMIGTAAGLPTGVTMALAVGLAFLFGYALSTVPLIQAGIGFGAALSVVFAADTLSIAVMELTDNFVMALIPGAMDAGLVNPIFWIGMMVALSAAFLAAFPVNRYLIDKGKGHALTHRFHEGHAGHDAHTGHGQHDQGGHGHEPGGDRRGHGDADDRTPSASPDQHHGHHGHH